MDSKIDPAILVVQVVASVLSLVLFLAPLNDVGISIKKVIFGQSTEASRRSDSKQIAQLNQTPYFCMLLSTLLWSTYGLLKNDVTICVVNGIGVLLSVFYLSRCYRMLENEHMASHGSDAEVVDVHYETKKRRFITKVSIPVLLWLFALAFCFLWNESYDIWLGRICVLATVVLFASPLSELRKVLLTRNGTSISTSLTIAQIANCFSWIIYGVLIGDMYVWIPNALGSALGLLAFGVKQHVSRNEIRNVLP